MIRSGLDDGVGGGLNMGRNTSGGQTSKSPPSRRKPELRLGSDYFCDVRMGHPVQKTEITGKVRLSK
jgi:hypothetical protein